MASLVPDGIYQHLLCLGYRSGAIKAAAETIVLNHCCWARVPIRILTEIDRSFFEKMVIYTAQATSGLGGTFLLDQHGRLRDRAGQSTWPCQRYGRTARYARCI